MDEAETFSFIELVQSHDNLWNISSNGYKNTIQRSLVWAEVGQQFQITGEKAKAMFKGLRDKYRRLKAKEAKRCSSGAGSYSKEKWPYYAHLHFLDSAFKRRRVTDSASWTANNETINTQVATNSENFISSDSEDTPQLTSPPQEKPKCSKARTSKKTESIEEIFKRTSQEIFGLLTPLQSEPAAPTSTPKYHSAVLDFIAETLGKLSPEDVDKCEKRLMKVATEFRYNF